MTRRGSPWIFLSTLALLAGVTACTIDDDVVRDIGVIQIFFTDPGIVGQSVPATDPQIQVSEWEIQEATLELGGNLLDLRFGDPCRFIDTARVIPIPDGTCASGIIIDSNTDPVTATLNLTFTMKVRRAEPVTLNPDHDGDMVDNATDLCPLIPDPGNLDDDSDGVGDVCAVFDPFTGAFATDNDSDGVADGADNCVWIQNPNQEDTMGVALSDGTHVIDGIGDLCVEQSIDVEAGTAIQTSIQINDFVQPRQTTFLTVDFNNASVLACNWSAGTCTLDTSALQMCVRTSLLAAVIGCS